MAETVGQFDERVDGVVAVPNVFESESREPAVQDVISGMSGYFGDKLCFVAGFSDEDQAAIDAGFLDDDDDLDFEMGVGIYAEDSDGWSSVGGVDVML